MSNSKYIDKSKSKIHINKNLISDMGGYPPILEKER